MKKIATMMFLVIVFTTAAFADGDLPNGTKTCQSNCLVVTTTVPTADDQKQAENDPFLSLSLFSRLENTLRELFNLE
jgi:hypothetical protein